MANDHIIMSVIPDAVLPPFADGPERCSGLPVVHFDTHPPELLALDEVERPWAAISQRPVAAHTIAQLRWVLCDESNSLFRRAELDHNYYVRRDVTRLHPLRLVLGQLANTLHAQGAPEASGVESLQNRIADIEKEVLTSPDIRDWGWGRLASTAALWAGGVAGSFIFLSAAFGVGVHKAPQVYHALEERWRRWRDKDDDDPPPPAASGGGGSVDRVSESPPGKNKGGVAVDRAATSTAPWQGWDSAANGYADTDWVGTALIGAAACLVWEALPSLGGWEMPELLRPELLHPELSPVF